MEIRLANTRGFCAGVDRAIEIVKKVIELHGAPVYVKHEVVHNKTVVEELKNLGAIFVEDIEEIPVGEVVVYSAHGISKAVEVQSGVRNLDVFDATCPLVSKVHAEVHTYAKMGFDCLLIGHKNHPEVEGTMGQFDTSYGGTITLIEDIEDAKKLSFKDSSNLAYVTQTTLSVDDTKDIIKILKEKFPKIKEPMKEDICYATTNRQNAVKKIAKLCEMFFVIGSRNSSNSLRLVEVAKKAGCQKSELIHHGKELPFDKIEKCKTIGISSGASAPEILVNDLMKKIKGKFEIKIEEVKVAEEKVVFKLPKELN